MNDRVLTAGTFRAVFGWRGDRWSQRLETTAGSTWQPVYESLEGTHDQAWPPSPPLQDLHEETRPGGLVLLLGVGRAGRSHWSVSIESDPRAGTIRFDWACRLVDPPARLGCRYRRIHAEDTSWLRVVPHTATLQLAKEDSSLTIEPPGVLLPCPATIRWDYTFTLNEPGST